MKCHEMPERLISLLYGETTPEEEKAIRAHIKLCTECRNAFEELQSTSSILNQWEDIEPKREFVFVRGHDSFTQKIRSRLNAMNRPSRFAWAIPAGAAAMLLLLSLTNFRASNRNGNWEVSFSLAPKSRSALTAAAVDSALFRTQQQTLQLVSQLIQESESRQRRDMTLTLAEYTQILEDRRRRDVELLGENLVGYQRSTEGRFSQTNDVLSDLIKFTSLKFERQ